MNSTNATVNYAIKYEIVVSDTIALNLTDILIKPPEPLNYSNFTLEEEVDIIEEIDEFAYIYE